MLTIDGLNSGLDTEAIVEGLLEIQQTHLDRLNLKKQGVLNEQAAFQSLDARLVTFRSTAARLGRLQDNVFGARNVSVSDESAVVASADSKAAVGVYQITVESLAQAHQVASQGFADSDSQVTQGTFTIQQGDRPAVNLTIDDTNDTLQGLADSINLSQSGVSASIVQDGSSGTPYRLLLTSSKTGESNAISVTNGLADTTGNTIKPAFDFLNPVQAAANSEIRLGTGPGALVAQSDDNNIDDVIAGVKLDLLQAESGRAITIRVNQDTETGTEAVQDFVDSYNSLVKFVADQTRYVPESDDAGLLLGNRSLIRIEATLQTALQTVVPGINSRANRLSSIGITFGDNGTLNFNQSVLQQVLSGEDENIAPDDVRRLFALDGTSTNSNIQFVLGTNRTEETANDEPIQVDVTQAAERAAVRSTNTIASSTVIDSSNNGLSLTLDGAQISVTLSDGTYTDAELAAEVEDVINAHPETTGRSISVGLEDDGAGANYLTLTSDSYGGSSQVTIQSGSAYAALGLTGIENDQGINVAGSFIVNGVVEAATGRGRLLSGNSDNASTANLQVRVTLSSSQVVSGADGELSISRGFASRMDKEIGKLLDSQTGLLKSINDGYTADADQIQDAIERQQELFAKQEQDLISQFVALESALGELQSTSSFLQQQFAGLSSLSSARR